MDLMPFMKLWGLAIEAPVAIAAARQLVGSIRLRDVARDLAFLGSGGGCLGGFWRGIKGAPKTPDVPVQSGELPAGSRIYSANGKPVVHLPGQAPAEPVEDIADLQGLRKTFARGEGSRVTVPSGVSSPEGVSGAGEVWRYSAQGRIAARRAPGRHVPRRSSFLRLHACGDQGHLRQPPCWLPNSSSEQTMDHAALR
jgi:hypothetical protein